MLVSFIFTAQVSITSAAQEPTKKITQKDKKKVAKKSEKAVSTPAPTVAPKPAKVPVAIPAKETAEVTKINSTYAIYLNTQFRASVPGSGISDQLGIEVYDNCLGKTVVYWERPLPKELGGWEDYEKTLMADVIDSMFLGTVIFIRFDENGLIISVDISERFKTFEGSYLGNG